MGKGSLNGMTGGSIQGNTLKTRKKDEEPFNGLMGGFMKGSGQTESNMAKAFMSPLMAKGKKGNRRWKKS